MPPRTSLHRLLSSLTSSTGPHQHHKSLSFTTAADRSSFFSSILASSSTSSFSSSSASSSAAASANKSAPAVLLVESPAKAKKIQEYLGPEYHVLASYGHIRDLPAKTGSVNPDEGFQMRWELADGARYRVSQIAAAVKIAPRVFLATDPDREGEAISWHLVEELKERGAFHAGLSPERITFTEVTKTAVQAALAAPREVSMPLVEAYMARRALDYLFGFNLSPLLWRKLPGARSAGRVQSVALRLVADREAAIEVFTARQYWTIHAHVELPLPLDSNNNSSSSSSSSSSSDNNRVKTVEATLTSIDGAVPPLPGFLDASEAENIKHRVAASTSWSVSSVSRRESSKLPPPPFTTSTLQQEANKRLSWGAARTMQLAQKLYEAGIITYMRTDGVSVAPEAVDALREVISTSLGATYLPATPRVYSTKSKNAQEAHEAIRPTDPSRLPTALLPQGFEAAAVQLYNLIWSRALASQMAAATTEHVGADFCSEDGALTLRATASYTTFPGYLTVYSSRAGGRGAASSSSSTAVDDDDDAEEINESSRITSSSSSFDRGGREGNIILTREETAGALSSLQQGQQVVLRDPIAAGHETRPPPHFSEGTLIKALEEAGIGRPSTYAPTLKLLQARKYVRKEGRALHAEPLGRVLSSFLCHYAPQYVDPGFTSQMEENLDSISAGKEEWKEVLTSFWGPFHSRVAELGRLTGTEVLDALNADLSVLLFGKEESFDHSSSSSSTSTIDNNNNNSNDGVGTSSSSTNSSASSSSISSTTAASENSLPSLLPPGRTCPSCGSALSLKLSHRGGPFVACSCYPDCTYSRSLIDAPGFAGTADQTSEDDGSGATNTTTPATTNSTTTTTTTTGSGPSGMELAEKYGMRGSVRVIGKDAFEKPVFVRQGPYGPYVQLGVDSDHDMRRVPLPKNLNIRTVKLDYALSLLSLPRLLGDHPVTGLPVEVRNGKFGPYVIHGTLMRSLPKELVPLGITLEEALLVLDAAIAASEKKAAREAAKSEAEAKREDASTSTTKNSSSTSEEKEEMAAAKKKQKRKKPSKKSLAKRSVEEEDEEGAHHHLSGGGREEFPSTSGAKVLRARSAFMYFIKGK